MVCSSPAFAQQGSTAGLFVLYDQPRRRTSAAKAIKFNATLDVRPAGRIPRRAHGARAERQTTDRGMVRGEVYGAEYLGTTQIDINQSIWLNVAADQMIEAAEAVDTGAGVLFIVKNYEGDRMNFTMAAEMAGREVATIVTDDDVAVENSTYTTGRRGVAGTLIVEKLV